MQNEYGQSERPRFESTTTLVNDASFPRGPLSAPSGEWISVNHQDLDTGPPQETFYPWPSLPPPLEPPPYANQAYGFGQQHHEEVQTQQLLLLRNATRSLFRRLQRLATLRADVQSLRKQTTLASTTSENYLSLVTQFQDEFMQEAEKLLARTEVELSADKLQSIYDQAVGVRERHDDCVQYTRELESRLSDIEVKMQRLEGKIKDAANKIDGILQRIKFPADSGSATEVVSDLLFAPSEHSSLDIPSVIQEYFDKAGDVKLEKHKLFDLDQEHAEEKDRRQNQRDQVTQEDQVLQDVVPLPVSDKDFEGHWLQVFVDAELAYTEAQAAAAQALDACRRAGLNPDDYRRAPAEVRADVPDTSGRDGDAQEAATPSSFALGSSRAVETPTKRVSGGPLGKLDFELEQPNDPFVPRTRWRNSLSRVQTWVKSIPDTEDTRSRALSETSPFIRIHDDDVSWPSTTERRPSGINRPRGSKASLLAQWLEDEADQDRVPAIKSSSSESELVVFHAQQSIQKRILADWRAGKIERYGTTADRCPQQGRDGLRPPPHDRPPEPHGLGENMSRNDSGHAQLAVSPNTKDEQVYSAPAPNEKRRHSIADAADGTTRDLQESNLEDESQFVREWSRTHWRRSR